MDTHKQKSMKEDLNPSSATLYVITTSVKCKEKNNFETMKFLIHKYTVISTLVHMRWSTVIKALLLR